MELTPRAKNAIRLAETEARSFDHPCVGSQHMILGLLLLGSGVQFSVLRKLGFTVDSLRQQIAAIGPRSEPSQKLCGFAVGSSAARALERAAQEAAAMSHTYTGTEHILLGLLSEESGGAADLFATLKVDTAKAKQVILDEYA